MIMRMVTVMIVSVMIISSSSDELYIFNSHFLTNLLTLADICSDSLYLSLTYSGAPGMTQSDPWVTQEDPWVTQDDP